MTTEDRYWDDDADEGRGGWREYVAPVVQEPRPYCECGDLHGWHTTAGVEGKCLRMRCTCRAYRPAAPVAQESPAPHSPWCSNSRHDHGLTCVLSCPTCGGVDLPALGSAQEPADPLPDFEADAFDVLCRFVSPVQAVAAAKTVLPILRAGIEAELREKLATDIWAKHLETFNYGHVEDLIAIVRGQS